MRSVGVRLVRVRVVHPDDVVPHVLTLDVKDWEVSGPPWGEYGNEEDLSLDHCRTQSGDSADADTSSVVP